jgi:pyruvate ferredoxin oxidoreductase beta subunit
VAKIGLKELSKQDDLLSGGHRACAGCAATIVVRQVLLAAGKNTVVGCATGCLEVVTTIFPFSAWKIPYIHNAFENVAATVSGVEASYTSLKRQGKITKDLRFIAFGGDGGTYDIGLQSLSGMAERGHRILYVCYDNEAYMNTGIQRSSATPIGAATSTCPSGDKIPGKQQYNKDLTKIMVAHRIPYVAQASPSHWSDLVEKVQKALSKDGPTFINVVAPCHRGWRYPMEKTIEMARLAVETCYWPLYEYDEGTWRITYMPKEKLPITEWTGKQGRFGHLKDKPEILAKAQAEVDRRWNELNALAGIGNLCESPWKEGKSAA